MDERPIGMFDSGLGGLTVARAVADALPGEDIVYFGDTARCPYGPRDLAEVRGFVLQIGTWLAARDVKLIVVACNTGTAAGLALAQRVFDVPVIGVVEPGARAAVKATVNRKVGVIGTVGTIESEAYPRAVRAIDAGVTVFSMATPKFVEAAEAGIRTGIYEVSRSYLDPLRRTGIDTLILGCTHFPLIDTAIRNGIGRGVQLISSAEEVAAEVVDTLERRGQLASAGRTGRHRFATTGDPGEFQRPGGSVFGGSLGHAERVELAALESLMDERLRAALVEAADADAREVAACE